VNIAQTSLDPQQLKEWTPNSKYGGHAFGFMPDPKDIKTRDTQFAEFLAARESILPWIKEYSPYEHVRRRSEAIIEQEINLSLHLGINYILLDLPKSDKIDNFAATINRYLSNPCLH